MAYTAPPKSRFTAPPKQEESWVDKASHHPFTEAALGAGDAVRQLLSLGLADKNPTNTHSPAYNRGHLMGDIGGFIGGGELADLGRGALEGVRGIGRGAQWLGREGLGGITRRLSGSALHGAATNADDRLAGAKEGAKSGLWGEALGLPFRALGAAAEYVNPARRARQTQEQIATEAEQAHNRMNAEYAPVLAHHGHQQVTRAPTRYLGYTREELNHMTPIARRSYEDFLARPSFTNLHNFQSQLGGEAAKVARTDIPSHQTMTMMRNEILEHHIPGHLGNQSPAHQQYERGRTVGREEYYPYRQGAALTKIAERRKMDYTPKQLSNEITKAIESRPPNNRIPEAHPLHEHLATNEGRINRGEAAKHIGTIAATGAGLLHSPQVSALMGGATHFIAPYLLNAAQNRSVQNLGNNYLSPALRAILQQASPR